MGLFGRGRRLRRAEQVVVVRLNARLRPLDRGEVFEDPLEERLGQRGLPVSVVGGGTMISAEGEPQLSDIELRVPADRMDQVLPAVVSVLEELGAPRGSEILGPREEPLRRFGVTDGLALYLNGTDLPAEVYAASDVNELIERIEECLADAGRMLSYWEGPRDTALYLYGPSAEVMRSRLEGLLARRPDAQLSRLEPIT